MTMHRSGAHPHQEASPLVRCLTDLANTPDDDVDLDRRLVTVAMLAAERIAAADYASITTQRDGGYVTVAASSEVARAVDEAQYGGNSGPCLDSVDTGAPVPVPEIGTAMQWPGFREEAFRLGLRASLSIPLFAGSGSPIAALNLYGRDHGVMAPLIEAVLTVFGAETDSDETDDPWPGALDDGGRELVAGLVESYAIRATIQRAIGVLIGRESCTAGEGYQVLRDRAAETRRTLRQTAAGLLAEKM